MIIWNGWGILVPIIAFLSIVLMQALTGAILGTEDLYKQQDWPKIVAFVVAAAVLWFLGRYLHSKPGRRLIDKKTGEEIIYEPRHVLFWIKIEYWAVILVVMGLLVPFL